MGYLFPSKEWLNAFVIGLNNDEQYAEIAKNWEGDIVFAIMPDDKGGEAMYFYLDLWHGRCREGRVIDPMEISTVDPRYVLEATRSRFKSVLDGELDPMGAMVTRKLKVKGDLAYMLRNVPIVLDFVRCAQEVGIEE
ncbi:MAG: hypothetical protein GTO18_01370 [Anaerolineales bacterium]|nr:hypothetical protein [Anaerolineales bacterium]